MSARHSRSAGSVTSTPAMRWYRSMLIVPGSGGVSGGGATELEGTYAMAWAQNIWADILA